LKTQDALTLEMFVSRFQRSNLDACSPSPYGLGFAYFAPLALFSGGDDRSKLMQPIVVPQGILRCAQDDSSNFPWLTA
jgi:hypothetical protein